MVADAAPPPVRGVAAQFHGGVDGGFDGGEPAGSFSATVLASASPPAPARAFPFSGTGTSSCFPAGSSSSSSCGSKAWYLPSPPRRCAAYFRATSRGTGGNFFLVTPVAPLHIGTLRRLDLRARAHAGVRSGRTDEQKGVAGNTAAVDRRRGSKARVATLPDGQNCVPLSRGARTAGRRAALLFSGRRAAAVRGDSTWRGRPLS